MLATNLQSSENIKLEIETSIEMLKETTRSNLESK